MTEKTRHRITEIFDELRQIKQEIDGPISEEIRNDYVSMDAQIYINLRLLAADRIDACDNVSDMLRVAMNELCSMTREEDEK